MPHSSVPRRTVLPKMSLAPHWEALGQGKSCFLPCCVLKILLRDPSWAKHVNRQPTPTLGHRTERAVQNLCWRCRVPTGSCDSEADRSQRSGREGGHPSRELWARPRGLKEAEEDGRFSFIICLIVEKNAQSDSHFKVINEFEVCRPKAATPRLEGIAVGVKGLFCSIRAEGSFPVLLRWNSFYS